MSKVKCPVCEIEGNCEQLALVGDYSPYECDVCGRFNMTGTVQTEAANTDIPKVSRAALSHRIRRHNMGGGKPPMIRQLKEFTDAVLPTVRQQAMNSIVFIGDHVSKHGERLRKAPIEFHAIIGAPNKPAADDLIKELCETKLVNGHQPIMTLAPMEHLTLTLTRWDRYHEEKRGLFGGNFGFLALSFGNTALNELKITTIVPCVAKLGYQLVDMRDVAKAGIIDNILREQIRDAAFVLADLSDDNHGAYWEAGYAEGLGKPVLYICEQEKFKAMSTHFDTNHCTTVIWTAGEEEKFASELQATLRRTLGLFSE